MEEVCLDDAGLCAVHPDVDGAKSPRPGKVYSSAQQFLGGSLFWQCGFLRPPGRQQHLVSARRRIAICGRTEAECAESCAFQPRYFRPKEWRANSFLLDAAPILAAVSSSIVPCEFGGNYASQEAREAMAWVCVGAAAVSAHLLHHSYFCPLSLPDYAPYVCL